MNFKRFLTFQKNFYITLQNGPPLLSRRFVKRKFTAFHTFSIEDDSRMEPDVVCKGDVRVIRTLNHELFACQQTICVQERCPANTSG